MLLAPQTPGWPLVDAALNVQASHEPQGSLFRCPAGRRDAVPVAFRHGCELFEGGESLPLRRVPPGFIVAPGPADPPLPPWLVQRLHGGIGSVLPLAGGERVAPPACGQRAIRVRQRAVGGAAPGGEGPGQVPRYAARVEQDRRFPRVRPGECLERLLSIRPSPVMQNPHLRYPRLPGRHPLEKEKRRWRREGSGIEDSLPQPQAGRRRCGKNCPRFFLKSRIS